MCSERGTVSSQTKRGRKVETNCGGVAVLCFFCTVSATLKQGRFLGRVCLPRRLVVSRRLKTVCSQDGTRPKGGTRSGPHLKGNRGVFVFDHQGGAPHRKRLVPLCTDCAQALAPRRTSTWWVGDFWTAPSLCKRVRHCCWCFPTLPTGSILSAWALPTVPSLLRGSSVMKAWPLSLTVS